MHSFKKARSKHSDGILKAHPVIFPRFSRLSGNLDLCVQAISDRRRDQFQIVDGTSLYIVFTYQTRSLQRRELRQLHAEQPLPPRRNRRGRGSRSN